LSAKKPSKDNISADESTAAREAASVDSSAHGKKNPPSNSEYARDCEPRNIGNALKDVYQKTVEEGVPDDLMNLLDKLR